MCENCSIVREQLWAEVRDLMNYKRKVKGPLSLKVEEALVAATAKAEENGWEIPDGEMSLEAIRAEMIAARCAGIALACPDTTYHGMPASEILARWAGCAMQAEMEAAMAASPFGAMLTALFGAIAEQDENEDDDDGE